MERTEKYHYERDHYEALRIDRQIEIAPAGVTTQHVIDLNRFCDCCEDEEGYDVPKERMRALKDAGLVEGGRFGWYKVTDAGQRVRDVWFDMRPNAQAQPPFFRSEAKAKRSAGAHGWASLSLLEWAPAE